jgi:hypothetical protein
MATSRVCFEILAFFTLFERLAKFGMFDEIRWVCVAKIAILFRYG